MLKFQKIAIRAIFLFFGLGSPLFAEEGISYSKMVIATKTYLTLSTNLQVIHLLEVDPNLYTIRPMKALDSGLGRESVLSIANRYGALAAVNGGFFTIGGTYDGKAAGVLKIHDWLGLSLKTRGCIGWSPKDQAPLIDRLEVMIEGKGHNQAFKIDGLNRERKEGEIVLYTPNFHRTTLTSQDGEELEIVDGVIRSINKQGSTLIPEKGAILSIQEKHPLFETFALKDSLTYAIQIHPLLDPSLLDRWKASEYIVGGTPVLIQHGMKISDFSKEQTRITFLTCRHARTAVGLLPNGHWLFVVIDKADEYSGMTMKELTDFMERLGCIEALNLDGGGSSTMVFEGKVINQPRGDEDEGNGQGVTRRVSDAIVIFKKD